MTVYAALILAAGDGERFGGEKPKPYSLLGDRVVLKHAVENFLMHPSIDYVQVVIRQKDIAIFETEFDELGILPPVLGGASRKESAFLGLKSLSKIKPDYVLIHDGARPFPKTDLIDRVITALKDNKAVTPALPVSDTVKRVNLNKMIVKNTLDRSGIWLAQTPQAFQYSKILEAYNLFSGKEFTDDSSLAEQAGIKSKIVMGNKDNLKITTQMDLKRALTIYTAQSYVTRVGSGFDIHRFGPGDHAVLCGIKIPHNQGLIAHSDGDVGFHAITDAIFGAISAGDLGTHFSDKDSKWKGANSAHFLKFAVNLLKERGGKILNIDVTIICELPKISNHRLKMRKKVSEISDVSLDQVSVKATTPEGLEILGNSKGIGAQAIVSVSVPENSKSIK